MNYYGLSGKMTARTGKREELLSILIAAAELLQKNNDCIQYVVGEMKDDENSIWINEVWTTKEAHAASLQPKEIQNLIMRAIPILAAKPQPGIKFTVIGGKGI